MFTWYRNKRRKVQREQYSRGFGAAFSAVILHGQDPNELGKTAMGSGNSFDLGVMEGLRHVSRYQYLENKEKSN